jgi:hypothetical protein
LVRTFASTCGMRIVCEYMHKRRFGTRERKTER